MPRIHFTREAYRMRGAYAYGKPHCALVVILPKRKRAVQIGAFYAFAYPFHAGA